MSPRAETAMSPRRFWLLPPRRPAGARRGAGRWLAASLLAAAAAAVAQEGHPLKGSWIGEWESNETHGEAVLVVLDWDGESITGVINPGTDDIPITDAALDPSDWCVRIEAEAEALSYVIDGRIEDLQLPSRRIVGTWRHDDGGGDFEIQRQ